MWLRGISVLVLAGVVCVAPARANENFSGLINNGKQAYQKAKFDDAERYHRMAMAVAEKDGDAAEMGEALGELGRVFIAKGRYEDARSLLLKSLEILRRSESKQYLPVTLNNLGLLSMKKGDYSQSEGYLKEGLRVLKQSNTNSPYAARLYSNFGTLYYTLGELGKAEKAFKSSIEVTEKELGPERAELALVLANLARVYSAKRNWKEATLLFDRALYLILSFPGSSQLELTDVVESVAMMNYARGDFAAAEKDLRKVYEAKLRIVGFAHPFVAGTELNLAATLTALNRSDEAKCLLVDALRIFERTAGAKSRETATTLEKLAELLRQSSRESEAAELAARADSIWFDLAHTVSVEQLH